ncbi:hypothetical protein [Alkalitalea saponilacus]|uniref:Uncharacterized protein n=1 Tax=Alkalitalea saponilacus TaxID=889453 RepID=A0A1T5HTS7_9BACT|nr:hypothetical protein [Alkalitalea saponilacus]ASB50238.1 hypothetical protein CDL62_14370 [Alkalitalea saponilacus]SKC24098.1 hypothetical protein SAMN03080601_03391 [Alkalitalea saponilacus]
MKTNYLFSSKFKKTGWLLFVTGIFLGLIYLIYQPEPTFLNVSVSSIAEQQSLFSKVSFFSMTKTNLFDEIVGLLLIIGALLVAFSKEKTEDELISKIRLESLVWATYINYAVLITTIIFVYDFAFLWVLKFNMFTILIFFIIRFNWALYKSKTLLQNEE